ncbi:MAG: hypothetical protein Q9218_002329 [Villophora microphyllina]
MADKAVARLAGINVGGPARIIPSGDFGLVGLAVMGQNLILNVADHDFTIVVFNRTVAKVDRFLDNEAKGNKHVVGTHSMEEFCLRLKKPRRIMLLVMAGKPVDDFINGLLPYVEEGDIIIDGGNSHYPDTNRRTQALKEKGIRFVGTGVSGGEEGARYGPSLMPGGNEEAWPYIKDVFQSIAAKSDGEPCCDWVGDNGAGHYVKMVHNGIEYGDMQLISEAYDIMKRGLGLSADEMADVFDKWNKGVLDSFLIEITRDVLRYKDDDGSPLVEKILDSAGQKGTGKWTAINALDLGMPVTLIGEAVFARCLSSLKAERGRANKLLEGPKIEKFSGNKQEFIDNLEQALYASKIISYAQGFMLIQNAAKEYSWKLNKPSIALMWRGGCIIRSVFLKDITSAYRKNPDLENLLFDDFFNKAIHKAQPGWRDIVSKGALWGIPTPAFNTALAWYDGYRTKDLPANLLQAQRDYFGAHTFRIKPEHASSKYPEGKDNHVNWTGRGGDVSASTYQALKGEKDSERHHESQHPHDHFPAPTIADPPSPSTSSSRISERSALDAAAHVHPPTPDMDGSDSSVRKRPLVLEHEDLQRATISKKRSSSRRHRRKLSQVHREGDHKHTLYSSDDGQGSMFSTPSTCDDVEMERMPSDDALTDDEETGLTGKDKRKRKRRRTLNAQMDERVAGSMNTSASRWSLADRNVIKASLVNGLLIASWYLFSVSISVYNRWMFGKKTLNFHFPLFTTCMHMAVQFLLASAVLYFVPRFRPRADSITNPGNRPSPLHREQSHGKPLMTRWFYLTRIGPCGTATGLDIGLGNMSFRFVTLTFFTMCKSSALAFILIFAFIFHLEQPSWKLVLIIATMTVGVIMMVAGETEFSPLGFCLIISASFFSGFRWALTQLLLLRNPATGNPFSSIFFLAPIMFLVLAIIAIPVEGFPALGEGLQIITAEHGTFFGIFILLFPGVLAFCMTSSEFALLQRTSVVTLSICGIFKEVVTITTANLVFHDPLTPINVSGLIVTIGSIATYNYIKITKMRRQAQEEVEQKLDINREGEQQPMLSEGGEAEIGAQAPRSELNGHIDQAVVKKTDERT